MAFGALLVAPAAAEARSCGNINGYYVGVSAKNTTCATARGVARGYQRAINGCGSVFTPCRARGFTCRGRRSAGRFRIRCASGRRVATFYIIPGD